MYDLWGSSITDWRIIVYQLFYPTGFQSIWNLGLLIIEFFISLLIIGYLSKIVSKQSHWTIPSLKLFGGIILFGSLIPIVAGIFIELYLVLTIRNFRSYVSTLKQDNKELKSPHFPQITHLSLRLMIIRVLMFLCILVAVLIPAYGLFVLIYNLDLMWGFIAIGSLLLLIWILVKSRICSNKHSDTRSNTIFEISKKVKKTISQNSLKISVLMIVIFGFVLALTWFNINHTTPDSYNPSIGNTNLSIVTYNIRNGVAQDGEDRWELRADYLIQQADGFHADIIGLQEAYLFQIEDIVNGLNSLNESVDFRWLGYGRDDGVHAGEHSPLLFDAQKLDLIDCDTFWYAETPEIPQKGFAENQCCKRVATWGRFEDRFNHNQFVVFSTHYGFGDEFSIPASNLLIEKMQEYSGTLPVFVIGDFNFADPSPGYNIMVDNTTQKPLMDAYSKVYGEGPHNIASINHFSPIPTSNPYKIDFIFVSENVEVLSCEVNQDTYFREGIERTYSDHYPVIANCVF